MDKNTAFLLIIASAILDIIANLMMKKSDGFKHKLYGVAGITLVCLAFGLLSLVAQVMDLAVAYAMWGALAIFGTAMSARFIFGQRINRVGWLGIAMILGSVYLLKNS